ncbi:16S rRNA (uracil1498-N3)-methyltransferase [Sporobacter termitidis DSM 10068]|uniref:Ribosomal RNA small subunit methyltransferase E n=1 Tax=Sporobacter termitidis DSM 10068 TaxID=1123282 RepID=A0A1M5WWG1_9FIRM|nr:RsmE family RNA methyltransferase [Sporobacter termitidis]SHH91986.1 16S rRNA (uracil1498-N3)-methyltransferase [Sporobacter termitidis DSM 10068]
MPRFFIAASNIFGGVAYLSAKEIEHLRALRIRHGESFTVCDGAGQDYTCRLTRLNDDGAEAEVVDIAPSAGEPSVFCAVYTAYSKGDKLETVVQKSVELGATELVLFPSARCVSKPETLSVLHKTSRLQKIAEEAAKQSGRGKIPWVTAVHSFENAVLSASKNELPLFLYESEKQQSLKDVLDGSAGVKTVSIMTGPEGGFEPEEAAFAAENGMKSVSVGPRILRCETAPVAALAAVMYHTGNL